MLVEVKGIRQTSTSRGISMRKHFPLFCLFFKRAQKMELSTATHQFQTYEESLALDCLVNLKVLKYKRNQACKTLDMRSQLVLMLCVPWISPVRLNCVYSLPLSKTRDLALIYVFSEFHLCVWTVLPQDCSLCLLLKFETTC